MRILNTEYGRQEKKKEPQRHSGYKYQKLGEFGALGGKYKGLILGMFSS